MTRLALQQTAVLDALHQDTIELIAICADSMPANSYFCLKNPDAAQRGLRAYRANAQALAETSLQASYPVLQQLLGAENFAHIAHDFWQHTPPQRGDLAHWGGELAVYLEQLPQLQALLLEHPYLPDVARVEWALHTASTATDAALEPNSFQLLACGDPARLRLIPSPGFALVRSAYPVVAIGQLHDERMREMHETSREAIAHGVAQTAAIYRQGLRPMLGIADAASAALMEATLHGQTLSAALDAAFAADEDFDFSTWLARSVQAGWLVGVSAT